MDFTTDYIKIAFHGVEMALLPQKAMYLPEYKYLIVSDLHLGKASHFVKHGIQVPDNHDDHDLARLQALLEKHLIETVIFLGDLFHSEYNASWEKFKSFRAIHKDKEFILVLGNHDILDPAAYAFLNVVDSLLIEHCFFTHEPLTSPPLGYANVYGHIHPGIRLIGKGRQSISLPCFMVRAQEMIVPAFGSFTGIYRLKPSSGDRVFIMDNRFISQIQ